MAECLAPVVARGWCNKHYLRWQNHGDPAISLLVGRPRGLGLHDAFRWHTPIPNGDCLLWPGTILNGRGYLKWRGKMYIAHRVAWEIANGPIPDGIELDHIACVGPSCVRTEHLRLATRKQNMENLRGATIRSKTGIRGVSPYSRGGFVATVYHAGTRHARYFADTAEAEQWVVAKRLELFTHNNKDRK